MVRFMTDVFVAKWLSDIRTGQKNPFGIYTVLTINQLWNQYETLFLLGTPVELHKKNGSRQEVLTV
jgi:hypothetical protein